MRKPLALIPVLLLTACAPPFGGSDNEPQVVRITITSTAPAAVSEVVASAVDKRADLYRQVLAAPGAYPVNYSNPYEPVGTYSYALTDMTGDGQAELLLRVNGRRYSPVLVFTSDDNGQLSQADSVLVDGDPGAGSVGTLVAGASPGKGLIQLTWYPTGTGIEAERFVLDSGKLVSAGRLQSGRSDVFQPSSPIPGATELIWYDSGDVAGVSAMAAGTLPESRPLPPVSPNIAVTPEPRNEVELVGVVREKTPAELDQSLVSRYGPIPPGDRFWNIELDQPQELTAHWIFGKKTTVHTVNELSLEVTGVGEAPGGIWYKFKDQHVRITVPADQIKHPNDPSPPTSMLRVGEYTAIELA